MSKSKLIKIPHTQANETENGLLIKVNDEFFVLVEETKEWTVISRHVGGAIYFNHTCKHCKFPSVDKVLSKMKFEGEPLFVFEGKHNPCWQVGQVLEEGRLRPTPMPFYTVVLHNLKRTKPEYRVHTLKATSRREAFNNTPSSDQVLFIFEANLSAFVVFAKG